MLVHAKVRVGTRSDGGYWKSPQLGYGTCQVHEDGVDAGLGCITYQLTYETEAEPTRQLAASTGMRVGYASDRT